MHSSIAKKFRTILTPAELESLRAEMQRDSEREELRREQEARERRDRRLKFDQIKKEMENPELCKQQQELATNEEKMKKIQEDIDTIRAVLEYDKELYEIFSDNLNDIKTKIDNLNQVLEKQIKDI